MADTSLLTSSHRGMLVVPLADVADAVHAVRFLERPDIAQDAGQLLGLTFPPNRHFVKAQLSSRLSRSDPQRLVHLVGVADVIVDLFPDDTVGDAA